MGITSVYFDPQRAMQLAADTAWPRRVGTVGERAAREQLTQSLEGWGYRVQAEEFRFTDAQSTALILAILLNQALILVTIWLLLTGSRWAALPAVLLAGLLLSSPVILRRVQAASLLPQDGVPEAGWPGLIQRFGGSFQAVNLIAHLSGSKPDPSGLHLILVAHYDSKSQRLPLVMRIALFTLGILGGTLFALLAVLAGVFPSLELPVLVTGFVVLLAGTPLWFLGAGNASPGAIDNASGVGVLLHLAELLGGQPEIDRHLEVTFLLTGAEELGILGAAVYAHRHAEALRAQAEQGQLLVLNIDGVGVDGSLRWVGRPSSKPYPSGPGLYSLVERACQEQGIPLKHFNLPGAMYDHQPFAALGLESGTLIAVSRGSAAIHTRRDTVERLHPRGFQQAGQVVLGLIAELLK